ncbi:MAG TPA: pseudouridine synthase [Kofleriaceae bacterium]|nr:pseudouridine synthase [Kofleriaceae bacterium]
MRLQRYLATAGVAARRKAEDLIVAGRVKVNGKVVTVLGTKIDPDHDSVLVDDEAVVALDHFYVLFNKPKGCITAVTDDRGRPTVMDYLPNLPVPVKPVGRLDFYSEGVLLLTNDGELAARLLAPANHVPKTYHVKVHGQLERGHIAALREGITLDDGTATMPAEVEILPGESKHTWLGITIHEGKHRQIHRMIEALGYQVDKLQRVAFANLTFHELRVGDARELTQQELNELRDSVGLDHSAIARGRWRAQRELTDIPRRARAKARVEAEAEAAALGGESEPRAGAQRDEVADYTDHTDGADGADAADRADRTDRADRADFGDRRRGLAPGASSFAGSRGRPGGSDRARTAKHARPMARRAGREDAAAGGSGGTSGQPRSRSAGGSGGTSGQSRSRPAGGSGGTSGQPRSRPAGGSGGTFGQSRSRPAGGSGGTSGQFRSRPAGGSGGTSGQFRSRPAGGSGGTSGQFRSRPAGGSGGTSGQFRSRPAGGSGGTSGQSRSKPARGSGRERGGDREMDLRRSGPGPGRRWDADRGTRGRGEKGPRDAGPAGGSGGAGGARSRGGGGVRGKGQGRSFGTRIPKRGDKT